MITFTTVKEVVNEHDMMGLLGAGSPENEYDIICDEIARIMPFVHDLETLEKVIYHIFGKWFCHNSFDVEYYKFLAKDIWDLRNK